VVFIHPSFQKKLKPMERKRPELEFTINKSEILKLLLRSKNSGAVVGINCPSMGSGVFLTGVEDVVMDYEVIVFLKPLDITGKLLEKDKIKLTEISSVCTFNTPYAIYESQPEKEENEEEFNFFSY
jgi:hypothetical protein